MKETRCSTPRLALMAALAVVASWRCAPAQVAVSPARATVGDTVWIARLIITPAGWRVRAGRLEGADQVEPLGDPSVLRAPEGWVIRYPVVVWSPGEHDLALPPVWRLAPNGQTDSLPGAIARIDVASVIPDSVPQPEPKPAIAPLRRHRRNPAALVIAIAFAAVLGGAGVAWRRRRPRSALPPLHVLLEPEVADARWVAALEPKAVASRAADRLRAAIAHAVPAASPALSTAECLASLERVLPHAIVTRLGDVLEQLDRVAFASVEETDVASLATRARALARELAP